jgi:hypothetical protein
VPEAKLTAALNKLAKEDFIRQFVQAAQTPAKEPPAPPSQSPVVTGSIDDLDLVAFQKWRWTEIAVTLGLVFVASSGRSGP